MPNRSSNGSFTRTDAEGLVQVRVENGESVLVFDFERWEALHQISSFMAGYYDNPDMVFRLNADGMQEWVFPVAALSGRLRNWIGKAIQISCPLPCFFNGGWRT